MKHEGVGIVVNAPAKINLFLEVTGRREDGYHEIDTVMQTVDLCDKLTVFFDPAKEGVFLTCGKKYVPTDSGNIAYRCAALFLERTGKRGAVRIHLEKRIPVAAGLGGGSADGAAVLKALNMLTHCDLSTEELCAFGKELGADIPFCVRGGCARATGIGERFSKAETLRGVIPVVAIGSKGSSTPAAYKALDDMGYTGEKNACRMLDALEKRDSLGVCTELYNAFETVILPQNEEARRLKERFLQLGADAAMLSGSGASVFGLFTDLKKARGVCGQLRREQYFAAVAPVVGRETGNNGHDA